MDVEAPASGELDTSLQPGVGGGDEARDGRTPPIGRGAPYLAERQDNQETGDEASDGGTSPIGRGAPYLAERHVRREDDDHANGDFVSARSKSFEALQASRPKRCPLEPSNEERARHEVAHTPYRSWA